MKKTIYGFVICTSADDITRETKDGQVEYGMSKVYLFPSEEKRNLAGYVSYCSTFEYMLENDELDNQLGEQKLMTKEEVYKEASDNSSITIQGPDFHMAYEFFEQEVDA